MSRCFPFPPPGYEKKPRTDDVDLLKKEKHREKKHKKEKDKEKREKKEKRDKEGRDGKHKEKKDKKEKHREKKKDKDKDRDKDKSKISTADEKGFPGQAHGPNAVKPHQKEVKQNDKKGILFEDKLSKQHAGNNGEKVRENNHLAENRDSKFLLELDRRIKNNDGGSGNHLVQKFTVANNRKDEGSVRLVAKGGGILPDVKEKVQDKGIESGKIDGRGIWPGALPIRNATVQNHVGNFHPRVDEMPRPLEKNFHRTLEATVEGRERATEKKDHKRGDKKKDKEEKKGNGKNKDRDKEKKKEEKAKEQTEHKNREQNKSNESNKAGLVGSNSFTQVSKDSHENSVDGGNLKKRKDIESNGVLHADDKRPTKLPRPSSSHPFTENGRALEPCQFSLLNASDGLGPAPNVKVENKERCKINGIIEALPSAVYSNKTPTTTLPADPVTEAHAKPPHPDAKYLSQVYSIPKTEAWSDFDDQEWLFSSSCSQERKPAVKSSEAGDMPQVWAEAVHIEPADIFALPYVVPY